MVNYMVELLANPIQSKEYGNRVDLITRWYYSDQEVCQYIILENGTVITILYDDIIPYILVSQMTQEEIEKLK